MLNMISSTDNIIKLAWSDKVSFEDKKTDELCQHAFNEGYTQGYDQGFYNCCNKGFNDGYHKSYCDNNLVPVMAYPVYQY